MADTKISALPSATIPLAGTELLPIVQGGATTKVAASAFQAPLVSGTNIKTVNSISLLGAGDVAVQPTLVSGTNIKTVNGNSLLGSGDLTISGGGSPGGSTTQVQFNDAGAFGGDAGLAFDKTTGKLTVGGKTVTASAPVLDLSQSWGNNLVAFTGIKFNVSSDVSASGSLLMDLQVGGVSKLKVDKSGYLTTSGNFTLGAVSYDGTALSGVTRMALPNLMLGTTAFSDRTGISNTAISASVSAFTISTGSGNNIILTPGSHVLEQRNGANGQALRVYGNYTTASDFRRLKMSMSLAGVAEIKPEDGGTYAGSTVLHISGLPTANPGPGILWNNGGVVNVGT